MAKITLYKESHTQLAAQMPISHWCKLERISVAWLLSRRSAASILAVNQAISICSFQGLILQLIIGIQWIQHSSPGLYPFRSGTFRALQVFNTSKKLGGGGGRFSACLTTGIQALQDRPVFSFLSDSSPAVSNSENILAICRSRLKCQSDNPLPKLQASISLLIMLFAIYFACIR